MKAIKQKKKPVVAIDTQILVWGVRRQGEPDQKQRARWLFKQLEDEQAYLILPSVALSEYLIPIERKRHSAVIAELSRRFFIAPFGIECISLAAALFAEHKTSLPSKQPHARIAMKADVQIIATAVAYKANRFYSGDKACRKIADESTNMLVYDVPRIAPDMFADLD